MKWHEKLLISFMVSCVVFLLIAQAPSIKPIYTKLCDLLNVNKPTAADDGEALTYTAATDKWGPALITVPWTDVFIVDAGGGGSYATIQAALTAQHTGGELFLVAPGTYTDDTINFSANDQCIRGLGLTAQQVVTAANARIVNFGAHTGCRIENIKMAVTAATTAIDTVTGTGSLNLRWCHVGMTANAATGVQTADQPSCIDTVGTVTMAKGTIEYTNNRTDGDGATAIKAAVRTDEDSNIIFNRTTFTIAGAGQSLAITPFYGQSGVGENPVFDAYRVKITVVDNATSNAIGFAYINISGDAVEMHGCDVHVTNTGANAFGAWLIGTGTLRSEFCHVHIVGTVARSFNAGAGTTVNSQFDDIIAANGTTGAGTINMVSSETDGNLTVTGLTASHPVFTDANDVLVSTGTMPVDQGGTNMTTYTAGDVLYASTAGILSGLADVAVNQVLVSGGVGVAPAYSGTPTVATVTTTGAGTIGADLEVNEAFTFDAFQTDTGDGDNTIDWGLGNNMYFTFGAQNCIIRFTAPPGSAVVRMIIKQDGVGSRTIDWSNIANILWPGNVEPTLSTTAAYVDIIVFLYDGTSWFGLFNGDFR